MKELTRLNISRIASITRNFLGIATPVELNALTQAIREKLNGQCIAVENTELGHLIMTLADTQRETQG